MYNTHTHTRIHVGVPSNGCDFSVYNSFNGFWLSFTVIHVITLDWFVISMMCKYLLFSLSLSFLTFREVRLFSCWRRRCCSLDVGIHRTFHWPGDYFPNTLGEKKNARETHNHGQIFTFAFPCTAFLDQSTLPMRTKKMFTVLWFLGVFGHFDGLHEP